MKINQLTLSPGLPLVNTNGITIKELKELVKDLPEVDPVTEKEYVVNIMTAEMTSSPVKSIWSMNRGDLVFDSKS